METGQECWSETGEMFNYGGLGELLDDTEEKFVGDVVYKGTSQKPSAKDFVSIYQMLESAGENAYDECGECTENYLCLSTEEETTLQKLVWDYLDSISPVTFCRVKDVHQYTLTAEDLS